jgi:hypothetical protein
VSHRVALALSIALTLVLATGVVAARDRFFAAPPLAGQPVAMSLSPATGETSSAPRVIEIALPVAQNDVVPALGSDERAYGDDEREHDSFDDDDRYEHDDDDEDDD